MATICLILEDEIDDAGNRVLRRQVAHGLHVGEQPDDNIDSQAFFYATALLRILDLGIIDEVIEERGDDIFNHLMDTSERELDD